ncbi:MAG: alkaline phosphatase family protein [Lentisphaeria bacterium]|nr:alkaline phosphatase family protein [Lentisphaeria bacterium]
MKDRVKIFMFSDALGYEIVQRYHFMMEELPVRLPVRTQFGYSSTCVPTILTGEPPTKHGHFSFFYRPKDAKSPFSIFRRLHPFLHPSAVFDNHRIRHRVSLWMQHRLHYTGYFNLYRVPYACLPFFDYCEKQDIFAPHGLAPVKNLRDVLTESGVPFHISNWHLTDDQNISEAKRLLEEERTEFFFIYTAGLDGMLHFHVHESEVVKKHLEAFSSKVRSLLETARAHFRQVDFCIFSDHGMTPLKGETDIKSRIEALPLKFGRDYIAAYDSTMLRVWFLDPNARKPVMDAVSDAPGHWLSAEEKAVLHVDFADCSYGDEIFLLDPGIQLVPSDMGNKPIPGMHGFSPDDRDSMACILSVHELTDHPREIADFFRLMKQAAFELKAAEG